MLKPEKPSVNMMKTMYTVETDIPGPNINKETKEIIFYSALKPIFLSMRLMGNFPYTVNSEKDLVQPPLCSRWYAYSVVSLSLQLVLALINVWWILNSLGRQEFLLDNVLPAGLSFLHLIIIFDKPFFTYTETRRLVGYINDWRAFETEYNRIIGRPMPKCIHFSAYILLVLSAIFTCLNMYFIVFRMFIFGSNWNAVIYIFVFTYIDLQVSYWIFSSFYIWKTGDNLLKCLLKVIAEEKNINRSKKIAQMRSLWLMLSQQTRAVGWVVGLTTSAQTLTSVSSLIIGMYALVVWVLYSPSLQNPPNSSYLTASQYFMLFFICEVTHRATAKVGDGFMKKLLRVTKSSSDHSTNIEVHTFCLAIAAQPPVMTIAKYVNVDRTLWTKFLVAVITYMMFLGQIQDSEGQ